MKIYRTAFNTHYFMSLGIPQETAQAIESYLSTISDKKHKKYITRKIGQIMREKGSVRHVRIFIIDSYDGSAILYKPQHAPQEISSFT